MATSREPLRVAAETVWQVPPLSVAPDGAAAAPEDACRYEAVRLFADRAAASLPGFAVGPANAAAVAALCRALDGVPLAIELAAARVRVLSVEQIAARLADRFGLLTTGNRTAPPRQRTLRATIDWSYELLTAAEQVLLRRLSVFAGWSLEMAEQVCADDDIPAGGRARPAGRAGGQVAGGASSRRCSARPATGCSTPSASTRRCGWPRRARPQPPAPAARLHRGAWRRATWRSGMALVPAPWSARVDVFRRYDVDARQRPGRC